MSSEIDGVHFVRAERPGKPIRWYVYAWRGGPCILKTTGPKKPRLGKTELAAISAAAAAETAIPPGTILSLSRAWRNPDKSKASSPEWEALGEGTRRVWGYQLDIIETRWGRTPLAVWNDARMVAKVKAWRDERAATPRTADLGVQVLDALLTFGTLGGQLSLNVAAKVPRIYRGGEREEIVWTPTDIQRFADAATAMQQPWMVDGLMLAALTGLRRQDLVSLTWQQVGEFAIVKKALKRSARKRRFATMPRIPELDSLLEELRKRVRADGVDTVLVNSRGRPWSGDGFGGSFNRVRDKAGIVQLDDEAGTAKRKHLHDVRGTFVTKLIEASDLSDREIADIMAWSPERVATIRRLYVDQASVVVAIGKRIEGASVKRPVKRSGE